MCGWKQDLDPEMIVWISSQETSQLPSRSGGETPAQCMAGDSTVFSGTLEEHIIFNSNKTLQPHGEHYVQGQWNRHVPGHI